MIEVNFLFGLALVWIVFAVFSDVKSREIPNWLNFSLIVFAIGFRFFYSLFSADDFSFFYQGLFGLGIFLVLGNLLYYSRVFAGGDAKLMIALGAVLPVFPTLKQNAEVFLFFLFLFFVVGGIYGIVGSVFISIKSFKKFKKGFPKTFSKNKRVLIIYSIFAISFLILGFFEGSFFYLGVVIFIIPYLYIFLKSIDEYCMVREISSSKLTPGDWLSQDVTIRGKTIKATWDGLSKEEIKLIKRYKKKVFVRHGIVFAPVFLISFVLFWILLGSSLFSFFNFF